LAKERRCYHGGSAFDRRGKPGDHGGADGAEPSRFAAVDFGEGPKIRAREHAMQQRATTAPEVNRDPLHHTRKMSAKLSEMIDRLRDDIDQVNEPQFKAMFETAAEVLRGLVTAFKHYEEKGEAAWDEKARTIR
jgi:hypothetical protein